MTDSNDRLKAAKGRLAAYAKASPNAFGAFAALSKAAMTPGHFDAAAKELIAVAISVATRCDDCILYHVAEARRHGASEAQLLEVLDIAVEMGGGPAVMYAGRALEAFRAT